MSNNTLKHLTTRWPNFLTEGISFTNIKIENPNVVDSKSGGGMVLLKGIEVLIAGKWIDAHLSFPPDKSGTGTFTEGHLKVESGPYLNQYFFACDENETWEVEQLANSPTAKTNKPGKWTHLPAVLWPDVDKLVTYLAYL